MMRVFLLLIVPLAIPCGLVHAEDNLTGQRVTRPLSSTLFRHQYTIYDRSFCGAQACVDFDDNGSRELLYASRETGNLQLLNAADGTVRWSKKFKGEQQTVSVYDLDRDGQFEILYSVSSPGHLYLLDHSGTLLRSYDSQDHKLGNSAVILDADGDGVLDGFFGTRSRYLVRMNMNKFTLLTRRSGWVQCGCYTSAIDIDHDGRWDLFAGSGDDFALKGSFHRYDPVTLKSTWSFDTNDNASSADAVLVDIDGDGQLEILKSVDNYKHDDSHDAVYAFEADGTMIWKVEGLSGEDTPNAADLDGDGSIEIIGMTFGGEVYCLDQHGKFKWRRDLRPKLDDGQHMYMCPILCDLDGDSELEILAMTHGQYSPTAGQKPTARLHALDAKGQVLDELDLGESRYWGHALVANIDDDPHHELVVSGYGGLDVFELGGIGPQTEHFQRRRSYQRLNVIPWAYEDSYFIQRGIRQKVINQTDDLVLAKKDGDYLGFGRFTTDKLVLPAGCHFSELDYSTDIPGGTAITVNIIDQAGRVIRESVQTGTSLSIDIDVKLQFIFSSTDPQQTPRLDDYSLRFDR
jgi:outer membrane protein assembly factor BamB